MLTHDCWLSRNVNIRLFRWSYALTEEYFRQGDREKELGLPCSTLCDRNTVLVPQSQFGFLRFIIEPSFNTLIDLFRYCVLLQCDCSRHRGYCLGIQQSTTSQKNRQIQTVWKMKNTERHKAIAETLSNVAQAPVRIKVRVTKEQHCSRAPPRAKRVDIVFQATRAFRTILILGSWLGWRSLATSGRLILKIIESLGRNEQKKTLRPKKQRGRTNQQTSHPT